MAGGAGDDTYFVDNTGDSVTENPGEGTDTVLSSVTHTLGAEVEDLWLTGAANINGTGNAFANTIVGNIGDNVLNGGGGGDTLFGSGGNDTYVVDNAGDSVTENPGEGTDRVRSSITYTLGANVEALFLIGAANINGTGNVLDNSLVGNAGDNVLSGGAGNDLLRGEGGNDTLNGGAGNDTLAGGDGNDTLDGAGDADTMTGGTGDDTYVVDNAGDSVTEDPGEGTDTVRSSITYTLGAAVEELDLIGTANINGTGNALDNKIFGTDGNNILNGGGGDDTLGGGGGADTLYGGTGNDTYIVNEAGPNIIENPGEGTDTVESSFSYALEPNVENLTLAASGFPLLRMNGFGNALDNTITGNGNGNDLYGYDGNDTLIGGGGDDRLDGGDGADAMTGGNGSDTYDVDNAADAVTEDPVLGIDTVRSLISYTLGANVENLILATGSINGTGNALDNAITGNADNNILGGGNGDDLLSGDAGQDVLDGGDGDDTLAAGDGADTLGGDQGNDSLTGGAGADSFLFDSPLNAAMNIDQVFDFSSVDDKVLLSDAVFTAAGPPGTLAANAFFVGPVAHDADDRIIYNTGTGALSYDPDGIGGASATQFATLSTGLALMNTNFQIV